MFLALPPFFVDVFFHSIHVAFVLVPLSVFWSITIPNFEEYVALVQRVDEYRVENASLCEENQELHVENASLKEKNGGVAKLAHEV